jgi:hypothetical protein
MHKIILGLGLLILLVDLSCTPMPTIDDNMIQFPANGKQTNGTERKLMDLFNMMERGI